jgi:hypothetical protein
MAALSPERKFQLRISESFDPLFWGHVAPAFYSQADQDDCRSKDRKRKPENW